MGGIELKSGDSRQNNGQKQPLGEHAWRSMNTLGPGTEQCSLPIFYHGLVKKELMVGVVIIL
jgi:hypothetical protein